MGIIIFAFLSESYILKKKDFRVKCALNFIQLYTKVVNLLNKNEHFKDRNTQMSTQRYIGKVWERRGIYEIVELRKFVLKKAVCWRGNLFVMFSC